MVAARPGDARATPVFPQSQVDSGCYRNSQCSSQVDSFSFAVLGETLRVSRAQLAPYKGTFCQRGARRRGAPSLLCRQQLCYAIENAWHKPVFPFPIPRPTMAWLLKINNHNWLFALLVTAHPDFSSTFKTFSKGSYGENSRRLSVNECKHRQPFKHAFVPNAGSSL